MNNGDDSLFMRVITRSVSYSTGGAIITHRQKLEGRMYLPQRDSPTFTLVLSCDIAKLGIKLSEYEFAWS